MSARASPSVKTGVAAAQSARTTLPVMGTLPVGEAFTGALSNLTTSVVDGVVTLSGTITGTGLPAGGTPFTAPIQDITTDAGCSILNLDVGPMNLYLLGLVVDLSAISLDVPAPVGITSAAGLAPSLHLNLGDGYLRQGRVADARAQLDAGIQAGSVLAPDGYGDMIRAGLNRLAQRLRAQAG